MENEENRQDLQDEKQDGLEADGRKTEENPVKEEKRKGRVFTQAEVDELFAKRMAKEKAKLEREFKEGEDYKEYTRLLEISREKDEQLAQAKEQMKQYQKEASAYKNRELLLKNHVDEKFLDFTDYSVSKMVDETTDYETALAAFLAQNGALVLAAPQNTGFKQAGQNEPSSLQSYLDEKYKNNPHYQKYKE